MTVRSLQAFFIMWFRIAEHARIGRHFAHLLEDMENTIYFAEEEMTALRERFEVLLHQRAASAEEVRLIRATPRADGRGAMPAAGLLTGSHVFVGDLSSAMKSQARQLQEHARSLYDEQCREVDLYKDLLAKVLLPRRAGGPRQPPADVSNGFLCLQARSEADQHRSNYEAAALEAQTAQEHARQLALAAQAEQGCYEALVRKLERIQQDNDDRRAKLEGGILRGEGGKSRRRLRRGLPWPLTPLLTPL